MEASLTCTRELELLLQNQCIVASCSQIHVYTEGSPIIANEVYSQGSVDKIVTKVRVVGFSPELLFIGRRWARLHCYILGYFVNFLLDLHPTLTLALICANSCRCLLKANAMGN